MFRSSYAQRGLIAALILAAAPAWAQPTSLVGPSDPPAAPAPEAKPLGAPGRPMLSPDRKAERPATNYFGSTILPLAGVLALIIFGGAVLRSGARRVGGLRASLGAGGRSPAGILEILGRYPVGRGMSLVLLKLDSRILLLSQSAGGRFGAGATFSTLAEITDAEQVASILIKARDAEGDSLAERFRTMLHRFDRQMDGQPTATDGTLWDGSRSDIPVIDLTKRPAPRKRLPSQRSGAQP